MNTCATCNANMQPTEETPVTIILNSGVSIRGLICRDCYAALLNGDEKASRALDQYTEKAVISGKVTTMQPYQFVGSSHHGRLN